MLRYFRYHFRHFIFLFFRLFFDAFSFSLRYFRHCHATLDYFFADFLSFSRRHFAITPRYFFLSGFSIPFRFIMRDIAAAAICHSLIFRFQMPHCRKFAFAPPLSLICRADADAFTSFPLIFPTPFSTRRLRRHAIFIDYACIDFADFDITTATPPLRYAPPFFIAIPIRCFRF